MSPIYYFCSVRGQCALTMKNFAADLNGDGIVDVTDLLLLLSSWDSNTHAGGIIMSRTLPFSSTGRFVLMCVMALSGAGSSLASDARGWWDVGPGQPGMNDRVQAFYVFTDPETGDSRLIAGGWFSTAGHVSASRVAQFVDDQWTSMGDAITLSDVSKFTLFDAGKGPRLFAAGGSGGFTSSLAYWDGRAWNEIKGAPHSWIGSIGIYENNGVEELYISGGFNHTTPEGQASYVTRWDGQQWGPVGDPGSAVHDMLVWNDGSGDGLFCAGSLAFPSDIGFCGGIGRWDGAAWQPVGPCGLSFSFGHALLLHDDGSGEAIYMGGFFSHVGGTAAANIAKWDGNAWSALASGINGTVMALAIFDDGDGPALFAAGEFSMAGGVAANNIARWDGRSWTALGEGANGAIHVLQAVGPEAGGPALVVGGDFTAIDGQPANRIAFWRPKQHPPIGDLNGDDVVDVSDLLLLFGAWGPCSAGQPCPADLNGDGNVDVTDLLLLLSNWG